MRYLTHDEMEAVGRAMECWEAPRSPEQTAAILARIGAAQRQGWRRELAGVAAALLMTAGAGLLAGWWSAPREAVPPEQAAAALHLDELGDSLAGGLEGVMGLADDDVTSEEVPG